MTFFMACLKVRWKADSAPPAFCLHSPVHRFERFWAGDCARLVDFAGQMNLYFAWSCNYPFLMAAKSNLSSGEFGRIHGPPTG